MPNRPQSAFDAWAEDHRVQLYFIAPDKPTQHSYFESFNGRYREECLTQHWFTNIDEGFNYRTKYTMLVLREAL